MGSFVGRGNQYIQLVKALYCKLLAIGKKLPSFADWVRGYQSGFKFLLPQYNHSRTSRVRIVKFATYLKFATCGKTNKINEWK